jgi:hypothetical protein
METENYDSDAGEFRLTENDSIRASRITEASVSYLTRNAVNMSICKMSCKDPEIKPTELFDIMEGICGDKNNLPQIHRVVNIIICDFIRNYPKQKVGGVEFIVHTIKPKPNIKDAYIEDDGDIILEYDYEQYREVVFHMENADGVWPAPGMVVKERTTSKQYTVLYYNKNEMYIECSYNDVTGIPQDGFIEFNPGDSVHTLRYTSFVVQ